MIEKILCYLFKHVLFEISKDKPFSIPIIKCIRCGDTCIPVPKHINCRCTK